MNMNEPPCTVSMVVAMTPEGVIGKDGKLPWGKLLQDLRHFQRLTAGKPVIIGRRTFMSDLGGKPLCGRHTIVLTRRSRQDIQSEEGCIVAYSPGDACAEAKQYALNTGGREVMVAGGAQVYKLFMPMARTLHITFVERHNGVRISGDRYFPFMRHIADPLNWKEELKGRIAEDDGYDLTLKVYHRILP